MSSAIVTIKTNPPIRATSNVTAKVKIPTEDKRKVGINLRALSNPAYGFYLEKEIISYMKVLFAGDELALPNNGYVEGKALGYPIAIQNPFKYHPDIERTEVLIRHGFDHTEFPTGKHAIVVNEAGLDYTLTAISDRNLATPTNYRTRAYIDTAFSDSGIKQPQHTGTMVISVRSPSNTVAEEAKCFAELVYMYLCAVKQLIIKDDNQIKSIPAISKSATTKDAQGAIPDAWITTINLSYTSEEAVYTGVHAWMKIIEAVIRVKDEADNELSRDVIPLK